MQGYIKDITQIAIGRLVKSNCQKLTKVHNVVCESWRIRHGLKFGLAKYQLIHITKKRNIDYPSRVKLKGGFLVKRATTVVNLDITLNSKLS